jgi:protein-S-isoprenylcysteine O-methyltransferase Ste14
MRKIFPSLLSFSLFILTLPLLYWVIQWPPSTTIDLCLLVGGMLLVFPVVWIGRRLLAGPSGASRVDWVVAIVHFLLMALFGAAIFRAIGVHGDWSDAVLPIPTGFGLVLVVLTGAVLLLTVVNLALKGLGAPFAIALSRRLASDWMYAWTRNPMALALLAFLFSLGIWFQSALFTLWILFLVTPAWLTFIKVFEERELEIRFGPSYLEYKARTPMLFPGRPKQ